MFPGVLLVTRGVGNDEFPPGGGKVAVGHVDGDALLPLGPQAVGEQREVHVLLAPQLAGFFQGIHLILENGLAVVEEPADQGALAVVHRPRGGESKQFPIQIFIDVVFKVVLYLLRAH
jgi:hypothetical protein